MINGDYIDGGNPEIVNVPTFHDDIEAIQTIFSEYIVDQVGSDVFDRVESMRRLDDELVRGMSPDAFEEYRLIIGSHRRAELMEIFRDESGDSSNESFEDAAMQATIKSLMANVDSSAEEDAYQEAFGVIFTRFEDIIEQELGDNRISEVSLHSSDAFTLDGLSFYIEADPNNKFEIMIFYSGGTIITNVYEHDFVSFIDIISDNQSAVAKEKVDLLPLYGHEILGINIDDVKENALKALHNTTLRLVMRHKNN